MKIVIANTDSMVEKLIEACAKKTGLKVQHFISLEEIDVSMLEDSFLFVDENALGSDTRRAKQIGSGSLSCLIYSRRKPLDEFKYLGQKPFLPTQGLEILRKELVRRGEDISKVVEEDNDKKAPIEPIKDIPLNEFDLKDEHLFEGNLELPPLPDTDAVETKTSAQSAKEQKEQDELQNDEENFLDVGENITHKSLAALERGQNEQGDISGEASNVASNEVGLDMPSDDSIGDDSGEQSLTESLVGELTEVNALGGESNQSSELGGMEGLDSDLGGDFALDSASDMASQTPDSAGDIRDSLAGGLDSLDSLDSLSNVDSTDSAEPLDLAVDLDTLNPVNSMKGNLAGVGALDSSLDSNLDSALESSLDSTEVAQEANIDSADLGAMDLESSVDLEEGVDLATQSESSQISEKDELLSGDSLEDLSSLGVPLQTDLADLGENITDSADIAQEIQEAQSSPDFAANGGVLDKDEAQTIQELLKGNSQDKLEVSEATNTNETAIEQATQASDIAESTNAKEEATQDNAQQEIPQEEVAQDDIAQEVANESSEANAVQTAEATDDFAELNENDIMEVLGEEATNENALDKQATPQQEPQEVTQESNIQDAEVAQADMADITEADSIAEIEKTAEIAEVAQSTPPTEEKSADEVASVVESADNIEGISENVEVGDIGGEVLKDLQDNLAKDLEQGLADELPTALQNDLVEGMPPTQDSTQDENIEQEDSAERVSRQLKELDSSLDKDLSSEGEIDESSATMTEDLASGVESSDLEASDFGNSDLEKGDLGEEVAKENAELPKSLEELESLVDSSDGDLGIEKLDSIIEGDSSEADLSADLADVNVNNNAQTADSSLDFANIPESGISQYLSVEETSKQDSLAKVAQNNSTKSTQKRLITELLANKSAEEISSLLEGAHIHIDIDFSQK